MPAFLHGFWGSNQVLVFLRQALDCLSYLSCPEHEILKAYMYCSLFCKVRIYCRGLVLALFIFSCELWGETALMCVLGGWGFSSLWCSSCHTHWTHVQEQPVLPYYLNILRLSVFKNVHWCFNSHHQVNFCVLPICIWKCNWWIKITRTQISVNELLNSKKW